MVIDRVYLSYLFVMLTLIIPLNNTHGAFLHNNQSSEIVTIDINDPTAASQLLTAYTTTGIAYFSGIPLASEKMREKILNTARRFFHSYTQSEKNSFRFGVPDYIRGYSSLGSEQYGTKYSDYSEHYVESLDIVNGMKPSDWPKALVESGLMVELEEYRKKASEAGAVILSLIEKALSLKSGFLVNRHQLALSNSTFRLNHYPAMKELERHGNIRFGEHTDFDTLSVVMLLDDAEGLQVKDIKGNWQSLKRRPGTVLVHVADMLNRWSNGRLVATPHRVFADETLTVWPERYSLIMFIAPSANTMVDPKDLYPDEHPKYQPVTAGQYLKDRLENIHGKSTGNN